MLVDVVSMLKRNPWIKDVKQVRRAYGETPGDTLEVDCDYRAPVALVKWNDSFWLVDDQGMKLPEAYTRQDLSKVVVGQDGNTHIRVIDGVRQPPPREPGQKWRGDDLAAGLGLVKALFAKPFANEVFVVNVENFDGRADEKEAQLVLVTKYGTKVRWGRPVNASDGFIEVTSSRKLEYMRKVFEQYGRVDANQPYGIDIRFDKITYPTVDPSGNAGAIHAGAVQAGARR